MAIHTKEGTVVLLIFQKFQPMGTQLHYFGPKVRQNAMTVNINRRECSLHSRQEEDRVHTLQKKKNTNYLNETKQTLSPKGGEKKKEKREEEEALKESCEAAGSFSPGAGGQVLGRASGLS